MVCYGSSRLAEDAAAWKLFPSPLVPRWLLWTVALADIGLWQMALGLAYAFRKRNE